MFGDSEIITRTSKTKIVLKSFYSNALMASLEMSCALTEEGPLLQCAVSKSDQTVWHKCFEQYSGTHTTLAGLGAFSLSLLLWKASFSLRFLSPGYVKASSLQEASRYQDSHAATWRHHILYRLRSYISKTPTKERERERERERNYG